MQARTKTICATLRVFIRVMKAVVSHLRPNPRGIAPLWGSFLSLVKTL
jgi:hypothetical protein